jgi:mannose-6-phosphate isomerase
MNVGSATDSRLVAQAIASLTIRPRPLRLLCPIRHYAWGGYEFIPSLVGLGTPQEQPCAELWIGAHPLAPAAAVVDAAVVPLDRLIACAPELLLGHDVAARFDSTLPFLLKILDVRAMLSIQAHPDKLRALAGFERENLATTPLSADARRYKDGSHKPEASVALTDFWLLYGFRQPEAVADVLATVPELQPLAPEFRLSLTAAGRGGAARRAVLRSLYERAMTLAQVDVDRLLRPLADRLLPPYHRGELDRGLPEFWAARAATQFPMVDGHLDRGIISMFLLNLVHLHPGQGIYIPAGVLHAYLEGTAVEIMANSDNVLRGGLTTKYVDVPELLTIVAFSSVTPTPLNPQPAAENERVYRTPADEFELSRLDVTASRPHRCGPVYGADVLLVTDGAVRLDAGGEAVDLARGSAAFVPSGLSYALRAPAGASLFRASVPHP